MLSSRPLDTRLVAFFVSLSLSRLSESFLSSSPPRLLLLGLFFFAAQIGRSLLAAVLPLSSLLLLCLLPSKLASQQARHTFLCLFSFSRCYQQTNNPSLYETSSLPALLFFIVRLFLPLLLFFFLFLCLVVFFLLVHSLPSQKDLQGSQERDRYLRLRFVFGEESLSRLLSFPSLLLLLVLLPSLTRMSQYTQIPPPPPPPSALLPPPPPPPPSSKTRVPGGLPGSSQPQPRAPSGRAGSGKEGEGNYEKEPGEALNRNNEGRAEEKAEVSFASSYPHYQEKKKQRGLFRDGPSSSDGLLSSPKGLRLAMETDQQQNAFTTDSAPPPYRTLGDYDADDGAGNHNGGTLLDFDSPRNVPTGCAPGEGESEGPTSLASLEMKRIIWAALWMLSLFLTLSSPGLPFGKYNIQWSDVLPLLYRWPGIFYVCGYLLLFYIFAGYGSIVTPRSWLAVGPALMCFHLFEEHGLNGLDARRSPFKNYFNETLKNQFGESPWAADFLSDASIMWTSFLHTLGTETPLDTLDTCRHICIREITRHRSTRLTGSSRETDRRNPDRETCISLW